MMNFWSLCTHFNIYCSFWRFWNAASFNLVLTSFSLEYVITVVFLPFSRFSAYFFDDLPVSLTISVSDVFTYLVFTFVPFTKTNLPADFCNIDTSRNFLSEGGGKQSLVPLQHRVTIATATGRERGVGFEGLDPADLLRRIVYVGSGQWERRIFLSENLAD